ncbi:MAG: hypothetical protein Q9163_004363 [Psora crenata]
MAGPQKLAIPMRLDAFVFNGKVCDGGDNAAKIAPINQPNYTFLQITRHLAQNDILDTVDLHNAWPRKANTRYTNLSTGQPRENRLGVYLHWEIPRPFRSGAAATETATEQPVTPPKPENPKLTSIAGGQPVLQADPSAPNYFQIPNQFLVIRTLDPNAATTVPQKTSVPPVQAWVIESDRTFSINELAQEDDIQVEKSPFITSFLDRDTPVDRVPINKQAEVFIGQRKDARDWRPGLQDDAFRVELTAASSSNQLFLDYQYHNGNVVSMIDNFSYTATDGKTQYLEAANANYYVLGWNRRPKKDLLDAGVNVNAKDPTRAGRLGGLNMALDDTIPKNNGVKDWLKLKDSSRSICHGAMYDVEWKADSLPDNRPADAFATMMNHRPPISIGTTPMDSILSYLSDRTQSNDPETILAKLQTLLRAANDSIDGYVAAEDEVQSYNYAHSDGGSFFYLPGADEKDRNDVGNAPKLEDQQKMRLTNSAQRLLDSIDRRMKQLRWELFACWWRTISDIDEAGNGLPGVSTEDYALTVSKLTESLESLEGLRHGLVENVIGAPQTPIKKGLVEGFHIRKDPTLMVAGLESGWPKDFSERLKVRLNEQIGPSKDGKDALDEYDLSSVPSDLIDVAKLLVREFLQLATHSDPDIPAPPESIPPLYHDGRFKGKVGADNPWRDRWASTQPWFPLYLEWEAEYTHINIDKWAFRRRPCSRQPKLAAPISYTLTEDVERNSNHDNRDDAKDIRVVNGRSLMLPQPAFSLKMHMDRLFLTIPKEMEQIVPKDKREELERDLERVNFLSLPLAGLTDHLITRMQGNHIKPLVRVPGYNPIIMKDVADVANKINLDGHLLQKIDTESDPTPYASLPSLVGHHFCAFKPVTHGQLRFTKLNVVDKFGQTVSALDMKDESPKPLYPSVGDFYAVDPVPFLSSPQPGQVGIRDSCSPTDIPNVVDRDRSPTMNRCEFIQLPPSINQPTRINASFVVHGDEKLEESFWRPATEWEDPVWGWIVINYVDNGIQFFQRDGTFYREVRITAGVSSEIKWLPFSPPANPAENKQLDYLIREMTAGDGLGQVYLRNFMNMISSALQNVTPAPSAYGQFMNSLVGRPLALVNMAWSLELDNKPFKNQSTVSDQAESIAKLPRALIPDPKYPKRPLYEFPLKLGDKNRNYDGLVGFFKTKVIPSPGTNDDLDLSKIFTYFGIDSRTSLGKDDLLQPIDDNKIYPYPSLKPFWLDPSGYKPIQETKKAYEKASCKYERERNEQFGTNVFGAIIDPFSPITGFSSILPVRTLTLPPWTWERALKKMTTFFHAGTLLTTVPTGGVPEFKKDAVLTPEYNLLASKPESVVGLPALQAADWNWLMPYAVPPEPTPPPPKNPGSPPTTPNSQRVRSEDPNDAEDPQPSPQPKPQLETKYMALGVSKVDNTLGVTGGGPMTAVEGFMQLRQPIERSEPLEDPVKS